MTSAIRVPVDPSLLRWARDRAGRKLADLRDRFPKLEEWEEGASQPTLRQLEDFARAVHVPFGYLFLQAPPDEPLPIPDFRTIEGRPVRRPSPDLLDTLHACRERQDWYRDYALATGQPEIPFVGSASLKTPVAEAARAMAKVLGFDVQARATCGTWIEAFRLLVNQAERAGVLVMVSGVVASQNHRRLDPEEFRGFALADRLAPLVFVNGADTRAGQLFTLAHELAHLWLGASALSDASPASIPGLRREEVWCNAVAAELLVPLDALRAELVTGEALDPSVPRLARHFKVSTLVILRRLRDEGRLDRATFEAAWRTELNHVRERAHKARDGGDYYRTTLARSSRRFTRALVESTLEGRTLYRDALRMLGVAKMETFRKIAESVEAIS